MSIWTVITIEDRAGTVRYRHVHGDSGEQAIAAVPRRHEAVVAAVEGAHSATVGTLDGWIVTPQPFRPL